MIISVKITIWTVFLNTQILPYLPWPNYVRHFLFRSVWFKLTAILFIGQCICLSDNDNGDSACEITQCARLKSLYISSLIRVYTNACFAMIETLLNRLNEHRM